MSDDLSLDPQTPPAEPSAPADPGSGGSPPAAQLDDNALVTVKVDGQEQTIPWKQAREGVQLHTAFTQKSQKLAEERRAWEQQVTAFNEQKAAYDQRMQQLSQVLQDPQQLAALYMLQSQRRNPASSQPQPLTTESLPQLQQALEQRFQKMLDERWQDFNTRQHASRIEQDFGGFLKGLLPKFPELEAVDGIDDVIASRVAALRPASVAEAQEQARIVVEAMHQKFQKHREEAAKRDALAKSQASIGLEPRGGQAVLPNLQNVKKLEDMDDAFIAFLNSGAQP